MVPHTGEYSPMHHHCPLEDYDAATISSMPSSEADAGAVAIATGQESVTSDRNIPGSVKCSFGMKRTRQGTTPAVQHEEDEINKTSDTSNTFTESSASSSFSWYDSSSDEEDVCGYTHHSLATSPPSSRGCCLPSNPGSLEATYQNYWGSGATAAASSWQVRVDLEWENGAGKGDESGSDESCSDDDGDGDDQWSYASEEKLPCALHEKLERDEELLEANIRRRTIRFETIPDIREIEPIPSCFHCSLFYTGQELQKMSDECRRLGATNADV